MPTYSYVRVLIVAVVGLVAGCTKEAVEPVQTVEWYKEHEPEMKAMRAKCANNPGQLGGTPNCLNAEKAFTLKMLAPGKPRTFDSMKPFDPKTDTIK